MMMKFILRVGWTVTLLLVCATTLWAQTTSPLLPVISHITNESEIITVASYLAEMKHDQMTKIIQLSEKGGESFDIRTGKSANKKSVGGDRKSPAKAFFYSAIIPGGGQYYNGSKWKALVFAGVEVMAWTSRASFNNKGDSKTDQFNDFADTHWSQTAYEDYLWANWQVRDDDSVFIGQFSAFTHHLPSTKTQQYYEMIGKYNQFIYGWDDMNPQTTDPEAHDYATSNNRQFYEEMRHDANKYFDNAKTSLIVVMFNHIISGTEAALAARSHNKKTSQFAQRISFNAYTVRNELESYPMLSMTYRF